MDRFGTERLADASFLEELLRGRRTLVVVYGDSATIVSQHLQKRLGGGVTVADPPFSAPLARPDRSVDAVVALGGFQEPEGVDKLISEARRVLAPGGLLAVSWVDPSRDSLEAIPVETGRPALSSAEAARRLQQRFSYVAVVARQPYLGFQFVSGIDNQGAVALDTSLTAGGAESPTGFLAIAADASQTLGDLLVQVPYDAAVARVKEWLRTQPPAAAVQAASPHLRAGQAVARPREGGSEIERLRSEVSGLRERAQGAVEESDRARGEARAARERASLLEAEVSKLRARVKGIPEAGVAELKASLDEVIVERDRARADAEGAAGEAARALEEAARYERECDHLGARIRALEEELAAAQETATQALKNVASAGSTADARNVDLKRRADQALERLDAAEKRAAQLDEARSAAERSAEDAWRRLREAQSVPAAPRTDGTGGRSGEAPDDSVPASDLAAAQVALAAAIARAENAEREHRKLREQELPRTAPVPADSEAAVTAAERAATAAEATAAGLAEEIAELERSLKSVREELEGARSRGEEAEARAIAAQRIAEDARVQVDALRVKAGDADVEGLRSLLHQRETALAEARERADGAEARAARFAGESSEALARLKIAEETIAEREIELKKALSALDGVESREARDKELIAELKGEVARLTEGVVSAREDLLHAQHRAAATEPPPFPPPEQAPAASAAEARERDQAIAAAGMAQAESARAHAEADALREELQGLQNEVVRVLAEADKRAGQDTERERRIADLEGQLMEARSRGESGGDIERRASAMAQKLAMLEAELERAKDDVKQATAEARKYRALAEAIDPPADRSGKI